MSQGDQSRDDDRVSLFMFGAILLERRRLIGTWMFVVGMVAVLTVAFKARVYSSTASFQPQGADAARSGLASIAGQFGVALPTANQTQSPDFYASLVMSRALLEQVAASTIAVEEMNGKRVAFMDLFEVDSGSLSRRQDDAVSILRQLVTASATKTTGVVEIVATTRWPSVSLAITSTLLRATDDFNRRTKQGQASAERKFIEGRLAIARSDLRSAEDRLQSFLSTNRQILGSPELTFQRDRLQRDVTLQQQVFTSLTQAYEDARIREVRDTPLITIVDAPSLPTVAEPRGRAKRGLIGILLGGFIGAIAAIVSRMIADRRAHGDPEALRFLNALSDVRAAVARRIPLMGRRSQS